MNELSGVLDLGLFLKVLDASLNGMYVYDLAAGVNTFVNAEYTRITGYDLAQLQAMDGETFHRLFHPDDLTAVLAHLAGLTSAADGECREVEYRFRHRSGEWIWCLSRGSVLERAGDGSARSIIGTFLDIGDRKRAEADLSLSRASVRERQAEIELIYDSAPIGLCILDCDLRYLRINQRLAEINGLPAEDHIGRTVREVLPGLADEVEPQMRRVIETGQPVPDVEVSGYVPSSPGTLRTWVESWLPLTDAEGRVTALNVVTREVTEERMAREALAESRERYRLVADYTYDWEYWVGHDGALRWMSPSCERITGFDAQAFLADPALLNRIVHDDDRPLLDHHREQFQAEHPHRFQLRIQRADGEARWVEHICQPVFGPDGSFSGRRVSVRDVTESREASEARDRREREFATLAENSPDIIARFDRDLRHLYVNAAVEKAAGMKPSQFLGKTNRELGMPEEMCAQWAAVLLSVFESGEPRNLDFTFPAPDRERFYSARAVPELGPDGSVETVLSSTRDETEHREARARAAMLATIVESSADFIGMAALDGRVLYINRAGRALVGLDDSNAGRSVTVEEHLYPEDLPFLHETVLPAVMETGHWAADFRFRHFVTGEAIDVHWYVVRIDDPVTGKPSRLATVTRDIRGEKAAEQALREADRRKDEFLTVLGHELRNPMAPIRNAVDILTLLAEGLSPKADWALQVLDRQTAHLGRLLDDLLEVSRIVRGKLKLERSAVELRDVLEQAADGVRPLVTERRHRFEVGLPPRGLLVDGDPVRLSQILLNLLLNAANYTGHDGEIGIGVESDDTQVIVRVTDNGPGIPPDRIEALFTPFSQGEQDGRPSPGGLGLGLTISRRLAEMHGGRLEAASAWPEPGSTFSLYLPRLTEAPAPAAEPQPTLRTGNQDTVRVLVVDDNADVASALAMLLQVLGYDVETASSGAQALELVEQRCPRLALLDIGLEDMDGLELARRLRTRFPDPKQLKLVAITGYGHEEARQRSLAAGFDEHLAKPVDARTLRTLIAGL